MKNNYPFRQTYGDGFPQHKINQKGDVRTPRVDLFEMEHQFYLRLSLPGVKKRNLKVYLTKQDLLEIKGEVTTTPPEHVKKVIIQEIYQGPFYRTVHIPGKVDKDTIAFSYNGGILEVILNKI
ncbi:Hsp20/alpha crystallin family protein [Bacillus sp. Marseille-P3661]|uniref:Hsp20/alpha crystallin family protein n=1 Tax=Bacillus sp. Marseille-P3661 TaxID=1936234 RepID=UPI000C825B04|nr:Hsp20/alpha crystallin family protein [Bacillus sp. Marseille-P3661]